MRALALALALACAACGASPVAPTPAVVVPPVATVAPVPTAPAPILCVGGQSNMVNLLPVLQTLTPTWGAPNGARAISYWNEGAAGWAEELPFLQAWCTAFVWAQGETDVLDGYALGSYALAEADLLQRVRAHTSARLPLFVVQVAPRFSVIWSEQSAGCAAVSGCTMLSTADLVFGDSIHLDDASLRTLAQRIVAVVPR